MDYAERLAEITRLCGEIVAGSRSVSKHCRLARLLEEGEQRDEAATTYVRASEIAEEHGHLLYACEAARCARRLAPSDRRIAHRHARLERGLERRGIRQHATPSRDQPEPRATTVVAIASARDRRNREALLRCTISVDVIAERPMLVVCEHARMIAATAWFERARYAVRVDGCAEDIPCTMTIPIAGGHTAHFLDLIPASDAAAAAFRRHATTIQADATHTLSNVAACVITPDDGGEPIILRNVFHHRPRAEDNAADANGER